jgi:hypothetical protein
MAFAGRIVGLLLAGALVAAAQSTPAAADWLPGGALYTFEVDQPGALLDLAYELKIASVFSGDLESLAQRAGIDARGFIRNLTGRGATYAMYPGDTGIWVVDAQDGRVLDPLQQFIKLAVGAQRIASPASTKGRNIFYQEYPGDVAAWSFDGKQFFARSGNRLVISSRSETLKTLFMPHPESLLSASDTYRAAKRAAGPSNAAWAYVNMAALNQFAPIQKGLALGSDPFDVILNGAWKQSLSDSHWLSTALRIDGKKLALHTVIDGYLSPAAAGMFSLPGESGVLPNLSVPRQLAAVTLWRDLGRFYAQKDTLFPLKTSGGILAENFMEIFFTGRNLTEEVFSRFHPQVRLVVARQQFDPKIGIPDEQYPSAALIFRTDPARAGDFGEVLEEAWQKAVGLTNFTRGQQALPGLILNRETHAGVTFTYGAFTARTEKDRQHLPIRFNLRPAIVHDGPYVILSTTDGLARDLIDAVHREDGRTGAKFTDAHTLIEVGSPADIAALLAINKPAMVRQSVLTKGIKPEQAAREFDQNIAWLDKITHAKLSISGSQADLELELK